MSAFPEIWARLVLVLADSFRTISYKEWKVRDQNSKLDVEATEGGTVLMVLGQRGSALVKLDGRPYGSIDESHKIVELPVGKHELVAEFSPYTSWHPREALQFGVPVTAVLRREVYDFWVYSEKVYEFASSSADPELREDLISLLLNALHEARFAGTTADQIVMAKHIWPKVPPDLQFEDTPPSRDAGFRVEADTSRYLRATSVLLDGLANLAKKYGKRGRMIGVAHAHVDAAWLWDFDETRNKVARTFSTVLNLMKNHDFHYIQTTPPYYEWCKEDFPELFDEIKKLVREGKWELGAGWVEFDANMISGESFARQFLYSQRFYQAEFGKTADVCWLPDSFGFTASLPQIAKQGGTKLFATSKLYINDTNPFPYSVFAWVGIDGTSIPSIIFGRGRDMYNSTFDISDFLEQWSNWSDKSQPMLYCYGYGNGGGGPTMEMFTRAKVFDTSPLLPSVNLGGTTEELREIKPTSEWRGELYLETHRGTYTSNSRMKYLNRRAETVLRESELWSTIASTYDRIVFQRLWKTVLKNQFHDILSGSAIAQVYSKAYAELDGVIKQAESITETSLNRLCDPGDTLVGFNSLPWDRIAYVVTPQPQQGSQRVSSGYLVRVDLPSVGLAEIKHQTPSAPVNIVEKDMCYEIENKFLKINLGKDGTLDSVFDKEASRETLRSRSNLLTAYENIPGPSDAWDIEKSYEMGSVEVNNVLESKLIENGDLRVGVSVSKKFRNSIIHQEISVYADSRGIEFKTTMDLHDRELLFKSYFNFDLNTETATYEIPFGSIERPTTVNTSFEQARFEVPMLRWVDVSERGYGVALLNDGKYGVSTKQSKVGLTLAKTPLFPDQTTDHGAFTFTYVMLPHRGDWRDGRVDDKAWELNSPVRLTHGASGRKSFIGIDCPDLMLEAVKQAEDDDSAILRFYERHNTRGSAGVSLWGKVSKARTADILENDDTNSDLDVKDAGIRVKYRNYQIVTLKVRMAH
jgi:alpha-mannosidase